MILKKLQLKNFKQYGKLELDFREGLVGVVGKNGSGKSSVFEAILLCLFGTISLDKNHYKSSWVELKESVSLQLTFEVQGKDWRVVREFRGKALAPKAGLYNQKEEMVATDSKPVTQEVIRLLGMDKDAFTRSVFSGQKELGIISNTKGEERKRMVRKMVGLDKLDDIQKIIREDRNTLSKEVQGQKKLLLTEEELQFIESQVVTLGKESKKLEKEEEKLKTVFEKKNKKYQEAKQVFDEQSGLSRQFNQFNLELEKWGEGVLRLKENLAKSNQEAERLNVLEKALKLIQPQVKSFLAQKEQEEIFEKARIQFDGQKSFLEKQKLLLTQQKSLQTKLEDLKKDFPKDFDLKKLGVEKKEKWQNCLSQQDIYEKDLAKNRLQKGTIQGRIGDRKSIVTNIENLGKEASCPTCLQPLINSYDETIGKLQKEIEAYEKEELTKIELQLEKIEEQLLSKKREARQLEKELNDLRNVFSQIASCEKEIVENQNDLQRVKVEIENFGKITYDSKQHLELKKTISGFQNTFIQFKSDENEVAKKSIVLAEIKNLKERIAKGEQSIKVQNKTIKALKFSPEKFKEVQQKMDTLEVEKEEAQNTWQQLLQQWQEVKAKFQATQKELDIHHKIENQIAESQASFFQLEELNGIFQTFKTQILERVRPSISHTSSQLFQKITRGRYEGITVDENFEFQILEDGEYYPISRFSGGEVDLANLCLRIGISRAIAELSGSEEGLSFLGFDEIFGSQDEDRRFEILKALDHLKEQYRQIYIVSHINSIKEHFPEILEVRKTENGSAVNWL
ncbi:MAG: AAA family ATPase [Saprospiraceae bacterium]